MLQLVTSRLLLRPFEDRDRAPFAAMNADPAVMSFFPGTFSSEESGEHLSRYQTQLERDGFSMLVAEDRNTGRFLGTIGMQTMRTVVPHLPQPAVELGWRLITSAQGYGYATEGARALIDYGFRTLHLSSLVAVTTHGNGPSRHVMEKLGMTFRPELTYEDARVPVGHPLQPHVLYCLRNPETHPPTLHPQNSSPEPLPSCSIPL